MLNKIKMIGAVAMLAVTMMLTSCVKENTVVGTWVISDYVINGEKDDYMIDHAWTFKEDGTCKYVMGDYAESGMWTMDGDNLKITTTNVAYNITTVLDFSIVEMKKNLLKLDGTYTFGYGDCGDLKISFTR